MVQHALRFGHLNKTDVKTLQSEQLVDGISVDSKAADETCEGCALGKATRFPFPKAGPKKSNSVLDLVHSDVCGPLNVVSVTLHCLLDIWVLQSLELWPHAFAWAH